MSDVDLLLLLVFAVSECNDISNTVNLSHLKTRREQKLSLLLAHCALFGANKNYGNNDD